MLLKLYVCMLIFFFYGSIYVYKNALDHSITFTNLKNPPPTSLHGFLHRVVFLNKFIALSQFYQLQMISTFIHFSNFEGKSEIDFDGDSHSLKSGTEESSPHNFVNEQMAPIAKKFIISHDEQFFDFDRYFKYAELSLTYDMNNIMVQEWLMHLVQNHTMVTLACQVFENIYRKCPSWFYAYAIGWLNMYCLKDNNVAEYWLKKAQTFSNSPPLVTNLLNSLHYIDKHYEQGIKETQIQIQKSSDPRTIQKLTKRLIWFQSLDYLSKAVVAYKNHFGEYPQNLEKLIETRIINKIPEDNIGEGFFWDADKKEVDSFNNPMTVIKNKYFQDISIPSHFH